MGGSSRKQIVGYKYYEDQHIVLALSNFDFISHFWWADKLAWQGMATGLSDGWEEIAINMPELFGGEKREGGVAGTVHIGMGWPNQTKLSRLVSRLGGTLMPAYRGVVSLFLDDFYFGNNYYIKALKVRAQAIHKLSDNTTQWYDGKAEIAEPVAGLSSYIAIPKHASDWKYQVESETGTSDYSAAALDDSAFPVGSAPFYKGSPHPYTALADWGTTGGTAIADDTRVWMRKSVFLSNPSDLTFTVAADDTPYLYMDGESISLSQSPLGIFTGTVSAAYGDHTVALLVEDSLAATGSLNYVFADLELSVQPFGVPTGDINPIHFIRECHTDKVWGGRFPDAKMGASYYTAADTIYDEGLGVSFLFTDQIEWKAIIEEINRHIDGISYQDPDTGLMEIKLIRNDYDVNTLPVLDPSNSDLLEITETLEVYNEVIIEFWNRETGEDDSITLSDPAAVEMAGGIKSKTYQYSGISNKRTATLVGNRDLARGNRPFHSGRVKTNRAVANLKPGDAFIQSSPDENIVQMVCRVIKRNESTLLNGDIVLEFAEDVFGQVYTTIAQPAESAWVDPIGSPQAFANETAFELPYYLIVQDQGETDTAALATDACFYGFAGSNPGTGGHIDYDLYVYPDGTSQTPDPEFSITAAFTPTATVTVAVDENALLIQVDALTGMESVHVGQIIMVGNTADTEREFLVVDAAVANGDTQLTVRRGLIDTTPKEIPVGTILYFVETFYGASETEYLPSETVEGYGTPVNGRGYFAGPYTYHDLTMAGRFYKPYPPGNLQIDSQSFPGAWYVPAARQVVFDWNHRDRVTQSDQAIDWFDSNDYGPEASTTYLVESDAYDADGQLITANWLSTNVGLVKTYTLDLDTNLPPANTLTLVVRLWTVRAGELSLQAASSTFLMPGTEILVDEYTGLPVLDTDGNYILMETP